MGPPFSLKRMSRDESNPIFYYFVVSACRTWLDSMFAAKSLEATVGHIPRLHGISHFF